MLYLKSIKAFTLIELMVVIAILALLMAIAIPNYIAYRNKAYCTQAESNASFVAGGIADYFGIGMRTDTPDITDLKLSIENPVQIFGDNPNINITIEVTDQSKRCPLSYQKTNKNWESGVFTKLIN